MTITTIHTALLNPKLYSTCPENGELDGHISILLYYFCRGLDPNGSGTAIVKIYEACQEFDKSRATIRRWMRDGLKLGFFRYVEKIKSGVYKIYYSSISHIVTKYDILYLGEIVELTNDQLKHIKIHATEANAIGSQTKSFYAATNGGKRKLVKRTLSAKNLCSKSKRILFLSDRFILTNPAYIIYGASQEYIAKQSGYHKSTIQRRLDDKYRISHGLKPVTKKQQCKRIDKEYAELEFKENKFLDSEGEENQLVFHSEKYKDLAFIPYTNIYDIDLTLRSQRYLRAKCNRLRVKKFYKNWCKEKLFSAFKVVLIRTNLICKKFSLEANKLSKSFTFNLDADFTITKSAKQKELETLEAACSNPNQFTLSQLLKIQT